MFICWVVGKQLGDRIFLGGVYKTCTRVKPSKMKCYKCIYFIHIGNDKSVTWVFYEGFSFIPRHHVGKKEQSKTFQKFNNTHDNRVDTVNTL